MADTQAVPQRVAFVQLEKFDATTNEFAGTMVSETPDESGEIFDYATSKPEVQKWIDAAKKRSGGKSLGNVRVMHGLQAAGKLTQVDFDDKVKKIRVRGKITNPQTRLEIAEGVLTGLSVGGKYLKTWPDATNPQHIRYTAGLNELSVVDSPCVQDATLELTLSTGTKVLKFSRTVPQVESVKAEVEESDEEFATRYAAETAAPVTTDAAKAAPTLVKRAGAATTEDDMTKDEMLAALAETKAAEKKAKADKKAAKLKKWVDIATPFKVDYAALSKAQRREFRARYEVDQALEKLGKVVGGSAAATAKAIVGPVDASDDKKVDEDGKPLTKVSDSKIAEATAARTKESL